MYKSKFKSRKEAFDYTMAMLPKAKNKTVVLRNYANAVREIKEGPATLIVPTNEESVLFQTFKYREGEVPLNVIEIDGDTILI